MVEGPINLLFADDEVDFLNSMTERLTARDINVIAVDSGEKAIEAAKNNPVDIALLDLKMPGMDGEETLKRLKAEHKWIEIVILTGHGSPESAVELTESGAYHYLLKPCDIDQLLLSLQAAYKKKIMNIKKIDEQKMDELLKMSTGGSPLAILRALKQME